MDDRRLESGLRNLGAHLDVDVDLAAGFDTRLTADAHRPAGRRRWAVAAVAVLVVGGVLALAIPSSRDAVARWFGLDGVSVDVDPSATVPDPGDEADDDADGAPVPSVYEVDGRSIAVTRVGGRFDDLMIEKTVGSSDQVHEVTVAGQPGLWFPSSHVVIYTTVDGDFVSEQVAGATLLVQTDDGIVRIEGFATSADAVEFATDLVADR